MNALTCAVLVIAMGRAFHALSNSSGGVSRTPTSFMLAILLLVLIPTFLIGSIICMFLRV